MRTGALRARLVCMLCCLSLAACAYKNERTDSAECAYADSPVYTGMSGQILASIDFRAMTDELAASLCSGDEFQSLRENADDALLVPDFVDLAVLQPGSIGLLLGERFRASLSNVCKVPIRQVDLSRDLALTPSGLLALTRDVSSVRKKQFPASSMMVGTYDLQPGRLTLVARLVSMERSVITKMATKEVTWRCDRSFLTGRSSLQKVMK